MSLTKVPSHFAIYASVHYGKLPDGQMVDYGTFVQRLVKEMGSDTLNILHAAVGISGEAGELLDAVKKHWAYGKPLDRENVLEELGDLEFYITALRMLLEASPGEIIQRNVEKLSKRYGDAYSDAAAIARADKAATGETEASGVYEKVLKEQKQVVAINLPAAAVAGMDETAGIVPPKTIEQIVNDKRDDAIGVMFVVGELTKEQADFLQSHPELPLEHFGNPQDQPLP